MSQYDDDDNEAEDDFYNYDEDGFSANEVNYNFDLQREITQAWVTKSIKAKKRMSPTMGAGNCERRSTLSHIPFENSFDSWTQFTFAIGNAIEDKLAEFLFKDAQNARLVHNGLWLNNKDMNIAAQADFLFEMRTGKDEFRLAIGEAKSGGELPFDPSPKKVTGDFWKDNEAKMERLMKKKYENVMQLRLYQAYLGLDGVMMYVSRNSQKGNGMANSPKYLNAFSAIVPFDEDEAVKSLARIFFSQASINKKVIPPIPETHQIPEGLTTQGKPYKTNGDKCGFCPFKNYCFKEWSFDVQEFTHMKEETIEPLWEWAYKQARIQMSNDKLTKRRYEVFMKLKNNIEDPKKSQQATVNFMKRCKSDRGYDFNLFKAMFSYQGFDIKEGLV